MEDFDSFEYICESIKEAFNILKDAFRFDDVDSSNPIVEAYTTINNGDNQ